jgi:hypothetical protein
MYAALRAARLRKTPVGRALALEHPLWCFASPQFFTPGKNRHKPSERYVPLRKIRINLWKIIQNKC